MGDDLDRILQEAAPPVSAGDPGVVREVGDVAVRARRSTQRHRGGLGVRRRGVAIGVAALAVAGTGVAAAAPTVLDWFDDQPADLVVEEDAGQADACLQAFRVEPFGRYTDDDLAVVTARETLAALDTATLDLEAARREIAPDPSDAVSDSDLLQAAVFQALLDEIDRRDLDKEAFTLEGATDCNVDDL